MKVLIVSSSFFPKVDGSTRCVYDHGRTLAAKGHTVHLMTRGIAGAKRFENLEGILIHRTAVSYRSGSTSSKARMMLEGVIRVILLNRRLKFDVIHAHGFLAGFAALPCKYLYGVPVVITTHGTELLWPKQMRWKSDAVVKLGLIFERFVLDRADIVIAQSQGVKQYMLRIYSPNLGPKIRIVHTGVDHRKFQPPGERRPTKTVMFVGSLSEIRGVSGLIDSFAAVHKDVPDAKLVLVGSGARAGFYKEYVGRLGLVDSVRFEGAVRDDAKLASLYRASDVVALPSNVGSPIPCTVLEGLSCGCAVISTNVPGGIPDILGGGVGFLVERGDWGKLTEEIRMLLTDEQTLSRTKATARKTVEENYTLDSMIDKLATIYSQLCRR